MPLTIGLSAYSIRLKRARERSKDFAIMTTGGEVDGWELFSTYLLDRRNQMMKVTHAEDEQSGTVTVSKAFKLVDLKQDKKNGTFCGLINAGECGRANSIYDVEKDVITHEKKITEADMPPFYFRLHVPDGATCAVLILQRTGLLGIKTALHRDLASWFSEKKLTLRMATLTDDDLLKAYLTHGTVDEILVATHKQSDDSRTLLNQSRIAGKAPPSGTKMEIRLSHDKGFKGALNAAAAAFRRSREVKDLVEVEGLDNPEEVAFRIDYGGQPKTFRILHPEEIGIKYDITRDVAYDKNNHPTFDSVNELAVKYCAELMERVNT